MTNKQCFQGCLCLHSLFYLWYQGNFQLIGKYKQKKNYDFDQEKFDFDAVLLLFFFLWTILCNFTETF